MNESKGWSEREQYWRDQMSKFESFEGSQRKFCEVEGINYNNFRNWRIRFSDKVRKTSKKEISSFIPVEVKSEDVGSSRADAKWVAEFLRHFLWAQR